MRFKVLTPKERRILRQVKTTKAQAKVIKARNVRLLEALDRACSGNGAVNNEVVPIGCPHCLGSGRNCSSCSWRIPRLKKLAKESGYNFCTFCNYATFGGISADTVPFVVYAPGWAMATSITIDGITRSAGLEMSKRFVKGHIEWADAVLEGRWNRRGRRG